MTARSAEATVTASTLAGTSCTRTAHTPRAATRAVTAAEAAARCSAGRGSDSECHSSRSAWPASVAVKPVAFRRSARAASAAVRALAQAL